MVNYKILSFLQVIAFRKVWHNMRPSCSFLLHPTTPDVATEVSCMVVAEQENDDDANAAHVVINEDVKKVT